jgi:hypothetical protein
MGKKRTCACGPVRVMCAYALCVLPYAPARSVRASLGMPPAARACTQPNAYDGDGIGLATCRAEPL